MVTSVRAKSASPVQLAEAALSDRAAREAVLWAGLMTGVLCLFAGGVHLLYAPVHFAERHDVGLFFVAVGVDQLAAGTLLIFGPLSRVVAGATLLGTLGVIGMYVASRTSGLPLGPNPGEAEPVGLLDLVTRLCEAMIVAFLAVLLVGQFGPPDTDEPAAAATRGDDPLP